MNKLYVLFLLIFLVSSCENTSTENEKQILPASLTQKSKVLLEKDGQTFRDLNSNGKLDIYEDERQSIEARINDVLSQMTLEEKAGMMFINGAPVSEDAKPDGKIGLTGPAARMPSVVENMDKLKMTHFNI